MKLLINKKKFEKIRFRLLLNFLKCENISVTTICLLVTKIIFLFNLKNNFFVFTGDRFKKNKRWRFAQKKTFISLEIFNKETFIKKYYYLKKKKGFPPKLYFLQFMSVNKPLEVDNIKTSVIKLNFEICFSVKEF